MQNAGLTEDCPVGETFLEEISFSTELGDCIEVERAGEKRIAYAAPGVSPVTVAVFSYRSDMYEFDLVSTRAFGYSVNEVAGAGVVCLLCLIGMVIGSGRDDCGAVEDVITLFNALYAVLFIGQVAEDNFDVGAVFFLQFSRKFFVRGFLSEKNETFELFGFHNVLQYLATH